MSDIKTAGFSGKELKEAGFTATELYNIGFTLTELASTTIAKKFTIKYNVQNLDLSTITVAKTND